MPQCSGPSRGGSSPCSPCSRPRGRCAWLRVAAVPAREERPALDRPCAPRPAGAVGTKGVPTLRLPASGQGRTKGYRKEGVSRGRPCPSRLPSSRSWPRKPLERPLRTVQAMAGRDFRPKAARGFSGLSWRSWPCARQDGLPAAHLLELPAHVRHRARRRIVGVGRPRWRRTVCGRRLRRGPGRGRYLG